jgi:peptidoglycan/LPS O-acetylase OafA/YrhL
MNRIPTLDGWRGLAISLVLIDHIQDSLMHHYFAPWSETGQHGVTIFFVLSGFLITSKLLEGKISLKRFYLRRFFRLMPAAWTYLAFLLIFGILSGSHPVSFTQLLACLFFYRNFTGTAIDGATGHYWSLSLEEQFYLVWPCIMLLVGVRRCRWIAVAGAAGCAIYRFFHWAYYDRILFDFQTQVRADALLVGCLLALLLADRHLLPAIARWSAFLAIPALAALAFCVARFHSLPPLCECLSIACLLAATTLHPASPWTHPLAFAPLAWLGTVSYSVYLWQAFFMIIGGLWAIFLFMPLFALASYYFMERPWTRFGHRLTGRVDLSL